MKNDKQMEYFKNQIIEYFECYIEMSEELEYELGQSVANIFCKSIENESRDLIQGVIDRFNEGL